MTSDSNLDRELEALCVETATDVLARELDAEDTLFDFAVATIRESLRSETVSEENFFEQLAGAILRRDEESAADEARAAEFVGDFVNALCNHPACLRSNSRKAAEYEILFSAVNDLSVSGEDEDKAAVNRRAMWEKFVDLLAEGDQPLWEIDHDGFQRAMVSAFETGTKYPGFSFVALAKAIQDRKVAAEIRRLRRKLGLPKLRSTRVAGDGYWPPGPRAWEEVK
jgi:hypothetical protein